MDSHSLATKDQSLLHRRNTSLLLNPFFHLADLYVVQVKTVVQRQYGKVAMAR